MLLDVEGRLSVWGDPEFYVNFIYMYILIYLLLKNHCDWLAISVMNVSLFLEHFTETEWEVNSDSVEEKQQSGGNRSENPSSNYYYFFSWACDVHGKGNFPSRPICTRFQTNEWCSCNISLFLYYLHWLDSALLADKAQLMVSSVQLCWRILLGGKKLGVQISAF